MFMLPDSTRVPLMDTHCHLDFSSFDPDREQVLNDAFALGVVQLIDPGIDLETSRKAVELAQAFPQVFAAVGLHPNESDQWKPETYASLKSLSASPKVIAIGEIGLDYYREKVQRSIQIQVLERQLSLAAELQLPVILHNREAGRDLLSILSNWVSELKMTDSKLLNRPGVLHSFSGAEAEAEQALLLNFKMGITGPVTFPSARKLQALVQQLPMDCLLIETDAPFLSPQPKRGQRNQPGYIRYTAEKLAELRQIPFEQVAAQTTANAQMLFQIGEKTFA